MTSHFVFVYGTLKRERPNHCLLCDVEKGIAKYLGEGRLVDRYPLVMASEYNIPFLLDAKNYPGSYHVKGEVYEVNEQMLAHMDTLENHPEVYQRKFTHITSDEPNVPTEVEAYFFHSFRPDVLSPSPTALTMYESFDLSHVEVYIHRHLRPAHNAFWPVIYKALRA
eukprot:CFRG8351T1